MIRRFIWWTVAMVTAAASGQTATNGLVTAILHNNQFVLQQGDRRSLCYLPAGPLPQPGDEILYSEKTPCKDPPWLNIVRNLKIRHHGEVPAPMELSVDELALGDHNLRTVTVEGLVENAFQDEIDARWIHLLLNGEGESVLVSAQKAEIGSSSLSALPGARISVTGVCIDTTPGGRQYVGRRLMLQRAVDLKIVREAPADNLDFPSLGNRSVLNARDICRLGRHSVTGTVLATWGRSLLLDNAGTGRVRIDLADGEALPRPGDTVKAAGLPESDLFKIILTSARVRPLAVPRRPPAPVGTTTDAERLFSGYGGRYDYDEHFFDSAVRLDGIVRDLPQSEFAHVPWNLQCGTTVVSVDTSGCPEALRDIRPGSRLSVTGIVVPTVEKWRPSDPFPRVTGLTLVPRTADDIRVLEQPPWWTTARLFALTLVLIAALVGFLVWNLIARRNARLRIAERTRLAVELHDSLSQNLTGIAFQIATTKSALANEPSAVARHLETAERMLSSSRTELKRCLWDLRVDTLGEPDFTRAIRRTLEPVLGTAHLVVRFAVPRPLMDDSLAHAVLCILRELAANAVRHGQARTVRIAGEHHDGKMSFSVKDDGCGFDPSRRPDGADGHFGLDGIGERVDRLEGRLLVESVPDNGTRVTISEIRL